ncbi:HAD family hydrolase [Leifsonia sp. C5G2]|uniref:HAD family hydrolase n=1 Tax=Leifsonia sp. C5G2 TaxID=2735269 RepID=UPI001585B5BD|nr:HAD family hydrolase [Leifsonia sp. C5G2]NUU05127.1 HAD family hydrolase [Leifsonia sp. C5G2]
MTPATAAQKPVLVLDFDGTVCIGDAPVWAYAEAVIAGILDDGDAEGSSIDADLRARLGAFLDGEPGSPAYADGYAAVAELAAGRADAELLQRAYQRSRRELASGRLDVSAPAGLAEFLDSLVDRVERVLVTNAPLAGVAETLSTLGLADHIDAIHAEAAKPGGWAALLPALLDGRDPALLLSVGDIWGNDLAAPLAAGCPVALIDRFGHRAGPAQLTATTFPELYPGIEDWAADPRGFVAAHLLPATTAAASLA